jgi:hypothetical protein
MNKNRWFHRLCLAASCLVYSLGAQASDNCENERQALNSCLSSRAECSRDLDCGGANQQCVNGTCQQTSTVCVWENVNTRPLGHYYGLTCDLDGCDVFVAQGGSPDYGYERYDMYERTERNTCTTEIRTSRYEVSQGCVCENGHCRQPTNLCPM